MASIRSPERLSSSLVFSNAIPRPWVSRCYIGWPVYAMTAAGLAIVYGFPHLPRPSPLVCILVLTGVSIYLGLDIRTIGDMGQLPDSLPLFLWPNVPLNLDTLLIVLPYSRRPWRPWWR
ncbi:hypothetical protein VNPA152081_20430 [Pseudomonas aeruginosa]|nr:hypothetical protein VNPA152081_20430 [Pseudomonas aeruginosa]